VDSGIDTKVTIATANKISNAAVREMPGWLDRFQPDVILLHIGTNDLGQQWNGPETITQTVKEVEDIISLIW